MKKRKIVPDFIIAQNKAEGHFSASVLLIDIVGFTRLTQNLMQQSIEGAEILHSILQTFFSASLEKIHQHNGFTAHFEGDAFWAIFPKTIPNPEKQALLATLEIQHFFLKNGTIPTKFGTFTIKVRMSLAAGNISWKWLEKLFYVYGSGIDKVKRASENCRPNAILADESFREKLPDYEKVLTIAKQKRKLSNLPETQLKNDFLPENPLQYEQLNIDFAGEFRFLIACFLQIKPEKFSKNILQILADIQTFKGFFKDINVYNGEYKLLVYFGAPYSIEKIAEAASDFALFCRQAYSDSIKISLAFGNSFIGFFENDFHNDFVAVSDVINLSARLLPQAKWGEILLEPALQSKLKAKYKTEFIKSENLKGFRRKIKLYKLLAKQEKMQINNHLPFVGRKKELMLLQQFSQPLTDKKFAGICYLEGKAGIGKTYLLQEFKNKTKSSFNWLHFKGNPIVKSAFQPIKQCLQDYFEQTNEKTNHNIENFEKHYKKLLKISNKQLKKDFVAAKPALAKFLNVRSDKDFELFSPEIQFRKMMAALDTFFLLIATDKPLILTIDDAPFLDEISFQWLQLFIEKSTSFPLAVIATVRKDKKPFSFFPEKKEFEHYLELKKLNNQEICQLVSAYTDKSKIEPVCQQFILKKSSGNPLYAQQITFYLVEHKLINQANANFTELEVPTDIRLLISARMENLNTNVRHILKIAAVIGEKFSLIILTGVAQKYQIKQELQIAEKEQFVAPSSETEYVFSHSLIRETVYQMQMKKEVREYHKQIAKMYLSVFQNSLSEHYGTIAFHFEKAEVIEKAIEYYLKAADMSKKNYFNAAALEYVNKLLPYQNNLTPKQYIRTLFIKTEVLQTIGNWKEAEELSKKALAHAEKYGFLEEKADLFTGLGWLEYMKGNMEASLWNINSAIEIFSQLNHKKGLSDAIGKKGIILMRSQKWQEAEKLFQQKIEWDRTCNNKNGLVSAYLNYAVFLNYRGQYEDSKSFYYKALDISNEIHDKASLTTAYGNLAILLMQERNLEKARVYFENALQLTLELGKQRPLVYLYGNFGNLFLMKLDLSKAAGLFKKQYQVSQKLNYPHGIILALLNKKNLEIEKRDFEKAAKHLQKALKIAKNGENQQEILTIIKSRSQLYLLFNYLEKALASYEEMLEFSLQKRNHFFHCLSLQGIGMVYEQKKEWQKAISYFDEAIELAEKYSYKSTRLLCLEKKLEIFYKQEKYQAILEIIKDKLDKNASRSIKLMELKAKFQVTKDVEFLQQLLAEIEKEIGKIDDKTNRLVEKTDIIPFYFEIETNQIFQNKLQNLQKEIEETEKNNLHFEDFQKMERIKEKVGKYVTRI